MDNNKKIIFGMFLTILFLSSVGLSYSYFSNNIVQNEVKDQVVETGTLSLRYVDGAEIIMQNIKPGDTITKTVYVANTGTLDAVYNLVWQELVNEITNDEMLIEGTCTRMNATTETEDGTCEAITSATISSSIIKDKVTIEPNIVHKYDLVITFKDTNFSQNYNQGKKFNGVLGIEEDETREPVNFETDNWDTIVNAVKENNTDKYNVGDTKEIDLGDTYGKHTVRIANKSTPSECSTEYFSQTACGFVLEFTDILFDSSFAFRSSYDDSDISKTLNKEVYNSFPDKLKNAMVLTYAAFNSSTGFDVYESEKLYLYLLNQYEITGRSYTALIYTRQLDYYKDNNTDSTNLSPAYKYDKNGDNKSYWLRYTPVDTGTDLPGVPSSYQFSSNGIYLVTSIASLGVSPAFRIG